jgi:Zn-finger nucleic acid-binding protein
MHLKADMESFCCDFCQSVYFPERNDDGVRVLEELSDKACPICDIPLVNAAIAKTRILYCTRCHGMLVLMPVFQSLVDDLQIDDGSGAKIQSPSDKSDLRRKIECPQCHHHMDTHFYAGPGNVVIDSCEDCCLIWLDRGELMRIVHASDGSIPYTQPLPGDLDSQQG